MRNDHSLCKRMGGEGKIVKRSSLVQMPHKGWVERMDSEITA